MRVKRIRTHTHTHQRFLDIGVSLFFAANFQAFLVLDIEGEILKLQILNPQP